jgi:hypothetical protein
MQFRDLVPEIIKRCIRFFYYRNERRKVFREIKIRRSQNGLIKQQYSPATQNLIVFFVEGANWFTGKDTISGGILSIASIYEETLKLKDIHNSECIMMTHRDAHLLEKHTQFPNEIAIFRFSQLLGFFKSLESLMIHIPEYLVPSILLQLSRHSKRLKSIKSLTINILNQNIMLMPPPEEIEKLKKLTPLITQTTAHESYSTIEIRQKYGIPLHKLSVFGCPEKYTYTPFEEKDDLMIVSPDEHPEKAKILDMIQSRFPNLCIQIIKNLTYTDYLKTIAKAKYALTFGEGLDFYFIETVFSGGIGFAVYNDRFFTPAFKELNEIYSSSLEMQTLLIDDLLNLQDSSYFKDRNNKQHYQCAVLYKYDEYLENIRKFYVSDYLFK